MDSERSNVSGVSSSYLICPAFQNYTVMDTKAIVLAELNFKRPDDLGHPENDPEFFGYLNFRRSQGDFFTPDDKICVDRIPEEEDKTTVLILSTSPSSLHVYMHNSGLVMEIRHEEVNQYIMNYDKDGKPNIDEDKLSAIFEIAYANKGIATQSNQN